MVSYRCEGASSEVIGHHLLDRLINIRYSSGSHGFWHSDMYINVNYLQLIGKGDKSMEPFADAIYSYS